MKETAIFKPTPVLKLMGAVNLVKLILPNKRQLWGKRIQSGQTGMIFAPRASGKTFFCLALAIAMSTAVDYLGLKSKKERKVIYLDGEMDLLSVQKRLLAIAKSLGVEVPTNLRVFSPELFTDLLPSINTPEGQRAIDEMIGKDFDVLFIDNYSAFNESGSETPEAWAPAIRWILDHKRDGRTVIVVHHSGKKGGQRGSSKHEDALDWVISLSPVVNAEANSSDLSFTLEWMKSRHLPLSEVQPITVTMSSTKEGVLAWNHCEGKPTNATVEQIIKLKSAGETNAKIGAKLGINATTVGRRLKAAAA